MVLEAVQVLGLWRRDGDGEGRAVGTTKVVTSPPRRVLDCVWLSDALFGWGENRATLTCLLYHVIARRIMSHDPRHPRSADDSHVKKLMYVQYLD